MNQLFSKMRMLSIRDLKQRRQEIFERTRKMMMAESFDVDEESVQETQNGMSMQQPMEVEHPIKNNKKNKKKEQNNRIRRYWRKILQVSDWMFEVPDNLAQFYVAARPDGNKCLAIFRDFHMQLRDKAGSLILDCQLKSKVYDQTILEAFYNKQNQNLVFSDLIVWKNNPMTSSEFQFRCAWLISNLNINNIRAWTQINAFFTTYYHCDVDGLKQAYFGVVSYQKEGLMFVHKDSFYLHGLNPNVLVWKDLAISKYLADQIEESKSGCKGIGFLNKEGEVKTIQNVTLFNVQRNQLDHTHRFLRFSYSNISIQNLQEDKVQVHLENLKVIETVRNYNGPTDSLSKLLYKFKIKQSILNIEQIAKACNFIAVETQSKT